MVKLLKTTVLLVAIAATTALFAEDPVYTPWSGTPTVDEVPYTTTLWNPLDPYGFSALKYALHYSNLFRTTGLTQANKEASLTNYVSRLQLAPVTNALWTALQNNASGTVVLSNLYTELSTQINTVSGRVDLTEAEILSLVGAVASLVTNPPSGPTEPVHAKFLWQSGTNIVLDAKGYRWLYSSQVVTGYTCIAQSTRDPRLVGTEFYQTDTLGEYKPTEEWLGASALRYSELAPPSWTFQFPGDETRVIPGSDDESLLVFEEAGMNVTFQRSTNLTYLTLRYVENFATTADLTQLHTDLSANIAGSTLVATNFARLYADTSSTAVKEYLRIPLANTSATAAENARAIQRLEYDITAINNTNITSAILDMFKTNGVDRLWGTGVSSNRYVELQGTSLVGYEISPGTAWYLETVDTLRPNGTFRIEGTPPWPERLAPLDTPVTNSYKVAVGGAPPANDCWFNIRGGFTGGINNSTVTRRNPDGSYVVWTHPPHEGPRFEPLLPTYGQYYPEGVTYYDASGVDVGSVRVYWQSDDGGPTNEIFRFDLSNPLSNPLLNTRLEPDDPSPRYNLFIITPDEE